MISQPIPFPTQLQAIIFDVDGTLYQLSSLRARLLRRLALRLPLHPIEIYRATRVIKAYRRSLESLRHEPEPCDIPERQFQAARHSTGFEPAVIRRLLTKYFEQAPLPLLRHCMQPGLESFLLAAKTRGISLGIVSDYPVTAKLAALGLTSFFPVTISASDPGAAFLKPHPSTLLRSLHQLGIARCNAIYVGDRVDVDVPCALRAGVHPIVLGNAPVAATYSRAGNIHELAQITGVLLA